MGLKEKATWVRCVRNVVFLLAEQISILWEMCKLKPKKRLGASNILAVVLYLNWAKFGEDKLLKVVCPNTRVKVNVTSENIARENRFFLAVHCNTYLNIWVGWDLRTY